MQVKVFIGLSGILFNDVLLKKKIRLANAVLYNCMYRIMYDLTLEF